MSRNVLVFGATGEIGGRIANLAVAAGHHVYGVTRGQNKREHVNLDGVEWIYGDKNDETFLKEKCSKLPIDAVIDSVPNIDCVDRYMTYFPQAANVFFCSSTGTFVPLQYMPADEKHPWKLETPVNFYSQCVRDDYAFRMFQEKGFPITIFRPTNIIGAGRVPLELWGGRDIEFFRKLKASQPVAITDCENILIQSGYNWDLASAFVLGLDHPEEVRGELFIISCKRAITLGTYLKTAMDYLGSKSEISHVSKDELLQRYPNVCWQYGLEFLLQHMSLDISKAQRILGYSPMKTTQQGLLDALQWCEQTGLL